MSSLIKKLEVAQQTNDIITPESSDVDSDLPISPVSIDNEKITHIDKLEIIIEDNNNEETITDISNNLS